MSSFKDADRVDDRPLSKYQYHMAALLYGVRNCVVGQPLKKITDVVGTICTVTLITLSYYYDNVVVHLGEEHLKFIVVYLMEVATCWASIGLFLGIPYKFIEVCKLEDSLEQSISTMVETWLRRKHDTTAFGEPTYRRLAEAVASRSGGGNLRLAEMIAKDHPLCYGGIFVLDFQLKRDNLESRKCLIN